MTLGGMGVSGHGLLESGQSAEVLSRDHMCVSRYAYDDFRSGCSGEPWIWHCCFSDDGDLRLGDSRLGSCTVRL
jgi:hypothetical protein